MVSGEFGPPTFHRTSGHNWSGGSHPAEMPCFSIANGSLPTSRPISACWSSPTELLESLRAPPGQELTAAWDTAGAGVVVVGLRTHLHRPVHRGRRPSSRPSLPILRSAYDAAPGGNARLRNTGHLATTVRANGRWRRHQHRRTRPASEVLDRLACGPPGRAGRPGSAADHLCDRVRVARSGRQSRSLPTGPADVQAGLDALDTYAADRVPPHRSIDASPTRLRRTDRRRFAGAPTNHREPSQPSSPGRDRCNRRGMPGGTCRSRCTAQE